MLPMENSNNKSSSDGTSFGVRFIDPKKVLFQIEIIPSDVVAEFGCGTGYFVFPVAKMTQGNGRVYALDILKEKLEVVDSQVKILGLTNVATKRVNLETEKGSGLQDESVDWVIMVNMLFQNKNKELIISEARRVLKPGGKILVIEWNPQDTSVGPQKSVRISKEALLEMAQKLALGLEKEIEVSDFHYGLILVK